MTARSNQIVTLGETMGLMAGAVPGPLMRGANLTLSFGGAETNVAIGASRLGMRTAWIGRLGRDSIGELILSQLVAEGVQASVTWDARPTGLMLKFPRTSKHSKVHYFRNDSAGSSMRPADLDLDLIRTSQILHMSGITPALSENCHETAWAALEEAQAANVTISFDVNFRARLWSKHQARKRLLPLLAKSDVIFATSEEARLVTGQSDEGVALEMLAGAHNAEVVIKRGSSGAHSYTSGSTFHAPALTVTAIDTVGAGDAFVAGYLTAKIRDLDPIDRLRLANKLGAFAVSSVGDWEGGPRTGELDELDDRNDDIVR